MIKRLHTCLGIDNFFFGLKAFVGPRSYFYKIGSTSVVKKKLLHRVGILKIRVCVSIPTNLFFFPPPYTLSGYNLSYWFLSLSQLCIHDVTLCNMNEYEQIKIVCIRAMIYFHSTTMRM